MEKLKLIGIFILLIGTVGCKRSNEDISFPSRAQAIEGCEEWVAVGQVIGDKNTRYCEDVIENNQVLGYEHQAVRGETMNHTVETNGNSKIVKRFRY